MAVPRNASFRHLLHAWAVASDHRADLRRLGALVLLLPGFVVHDFPFDESGRVARDRAGLHALGGCFIARRVSARPESARRRGGGTGWLAIRLAHQTDL